MNQKITIPLSGEDLQELMVGKTFDWCFDGIEVHLIMSEEGEE